MRAVSRPTTIPPYRQARVALGLRSGRRSFGFPHRHALVAWWLAGAALLLPGGELRAQTGGGLAETSDAATTPGSNSSAASDMDEVERRILERDFLLFTGSMMGEQTLEEAPSGVIIITDQDIRSSGARSLGEALERCAGLELQPGNHLAIRGLGQANPVGGTGDASRILLLIDGVRVNDVFSDSFSVGPSRGVHDIARIEVMKGPGSALYGTSAFAGVVQVITLRGSERSGLEGRVQAASSGRNGAELRGGWRGAQADGALSAHALSLGLSPGSLGLRGSARWRAWTVLGEYGAFLTPASGGEGASALPELGDEVTASSAAAAEPPSFLLDQQGHLALLFERGFSRRVHGFARASAGTKARSHPDGGSLFLEARLDGEARLRLRIHPRLQSVIGAEVRTEQALSPLSPETLESSTLRRQVAAAYALAELGPLFQTTLSMSVRGEQNATQVGATSGAATSQSSGLQQISRQTSFQRAAPRIGVVSALPSQTIVKLFYGQAFQAPTLSMLYFDTQLETVRILSNPALQPERLTSIELELRQSLPFQLHAQLNLFHNLVRDMIGVEELESESVLQFANLNEARIRGLDAELVWTPISMLAVFGSASLKESSFTDLNQPIPLVPTITYNVGMRGRPQEGSHCYVALSYVGPRPGGPGQPVPEDRMLEGQMRVDARVSTRLGRRIELGLTVRNLLGRQHQDVADAQLVTSPGTEAWLELSWLPPPHSSRAWGGI